MSDFSNRFLVPTFNGLVAQIGLSVGISVVCTGFFEWNRRKKTLEYLYSPRCRLSVDPSPPVPSRFMGWVMPTIRMPEEFYINNVGLDAVMFLRFLKMCLQFCIFNGVVVGCILLPIHYHAGGSLTEVPRMSIMNVPDDSHLLWAHVFLTYLITISWMFLLFKNYWQWMDLRREYTLQRIRQGEIAERSIFISRLPSNLRSDASLRQYFESLKMGPVESATVVQHCGRLSQKIDRREGALNMLEKAHIELARAALESIKAGTFSWNLTQGETLDDKSLTEASTAPVVSYRVDNRDNKNIHKSVARDDDTVIKNDNDKNNLMVHHDSTDNNNNGNNNPHMDQSTLQRMVMDLFRDRSQYERIRKSIFEKKRLLTEASADSKRENPQPSHYAAPLSELSSLPSHDIAIVVHSKDESIAKATRHGEVSAITIWRALASLDRHLLDSYQPKKQEKRFKGGPRIHSIDYFVKKYNRLDRKVEELRDGSLRYKSTSYGFVTFKHYLSAQLCAQTALSSRFKFLEPILRESPLIQSLLQNVLPIVFVTIFLALAPVIILAISKQELPVSHSALEGNVLRRYYHFLIFNVLFVFMIGTAILKSIITLIQKPTNIFTLLAASLPSGSTFFVFYIVFNTCTHFLELVQVWAQLVIHAFATARKFTRTPRALQRAITPWCFQFYYYYPQNILAMVITLIYSCINPLILLAAIFYFGFALLIFKYQFAYCYIRKYERSGRYFRHVFQYTSDGLIIFQVTMIGVLWLKQAIVAGFFIVALLGMTIYFKILCGDLFKSRTKFLPLDTGLRSLDSDVLETPHDDEPRVSVSSRSSINDSNSNIRKRNVGSAGSVGKVADSEKDDVMPSSSHEVHTEVSENSVTGIGQHPGTFSRLRVAAGQSDRYKKLLHNDSVEDVALSDNFLEPSEKGMTVHHKEGSAMITQQNHQNGDGYKITHMYGDLDDMPEAGASVDDAVADSMILSEGHAEYGDGFMEENGYFTTSVGPYQSLYACRTAASHFEHKASRIRYQDRTSEFETYIHPALLKPLNRQLWLPINPLYDHWDLDNTTETTIALNSSLTNDKLVFRTKEADGPLHSPRSPYDQQSMRRNTGGSNFDRGANHVPRTKSVWEGCLNDPDPAENRNLDEKGPLEEGVMNKGSVRRPTMAGRSSTIAGPSDQVAHHRYHYQNTPQTPPPAPLTHSLSLTSVPVLSEDPKQVPQFATELVDEPACIDGGLSRRTTRSKRSSSMPPEPILIGVGNMPALTSPPLVFRMSAAPQRPRISPLVMPKPTQSRLAPLRSLSQGPCPGSSSPGMSFTGENPSKAMSSLAVRSTMFGAPLIHRKGHQAQNRSSSGIGTVVGSSSNPPRRNTGGLLNMIFGRYDDDDVYDGTGERSQFGYETGGVWNNRRGSIDLRDDDDDDDDDESDEGHEQDRLQAPNNAVAGSPKTTSLREYGGGALGQEEMQLAQPSHLDLSDSLTPTVPEPRPGFIRRTMSYLRESEQA
ncbi:hypothetical protein BGX28_001867 [Mortierella sp. GBA30]|nr:hypothetical protein BGX28_001867 [Mortierella sp. GBA30]